MVSARRPFESFHSTVAVSSHSPHERSARGEAAHARGRGAGGRGLVQRPRPSPRHARRQGWQPA
eukprot:6614074-Prymnesium_polylepis.1